MGVRYYPRITTTSFLHKMRRRGPTIQLLDTRPLIATVTMPARANVSHIAVF